MVAAAPNTKLPPTSTLSRYVSVDEFARCVHSPPLIVQLPVMFRFERAVEATYNRPVLCSLTRKPLFHEGGIIALERYVHHHIAGVASAPGKDACLNIEGRTRQ